MSSMKNARALCAGIGAALLLSTWQVSFAGPLRERILERRAMPGDSAEASLPAGIRVIRDIPYGSDAQQHFDVYAPPRAKGAPVIFMVHGGAWSLGDKTARSVVENKVARWVPQGFIVVSTNYRLLPEAGPVAQAGDVARALATAQDEAASWGGDRARFILMGHSAGAHLVALLAAAPALSAGQVTTPWLGTVALDSAALDVVKIMTARHARFYDRAFGDDPDYWQAASPLHALTEPGRPFLAVCSTRRADSCAQAGQFVAKAASLGTRASLLEEDLAHREINDGLGEAGAYTDAVESFMGGLDESVARILAHSAMPHGTPE